MRILIVTDAWAPQVNGVVRTLHSVRAEIEARGHEVHIISPDLFRSIPCPTYPEIRLALGAGRAVAREIEAIAPDSLHLATEGPLGLAARRWCLKHGHAFTTAYHTQFPAYLAKRTGLPARWFWRFIRWFHGPASAVLVSTPSVAAQLRDQGLVRARLWGRGVDIGCFRPGITPHPVLASLPRPLMLCVGRVSVEKNLDAFLGCRHPGSKAVVGDGPALDAMRRRYPEATFLGPFHGDALAAAYATADVFVFPSRTDTFGLVMIEALACGTPVAAFPVVGPRDVLNDRVGAMDERLEVAITAALTRDREACADHGRNFSWAASADQFEASLVPLRQSAHRQRSAGPVGDGEDQAQTQRAQQQGHPA